MGGSDMQQEEKKQSLVKTARVNDGYLQQGVHLWLDTIRHIDKGNTFGVVLINQISS